MRGWSVLCRVGPHKPYTALVLASALLFLIGSVQLVQAQKFSVLYSFQNTTDGSNPQAGLFLNSAIYGTTFVGGDPTCGCGTAFELVNGTFTTVHTFVGLDGANPVGNLIADANGNLYGTTSQGGASSAGTVFELSPPSTLSGSWTERVLYSFSGGAAGGHPFAGLIQDSAGNFYGTTNGGGVFNYGTVFKLDALGNETVLYSFRGTPDGASPYAGVIRGAADDLYGTTYGGGAFNAGTVFRVSATGKEILIHSLNGTTDGAYPSGTLTADASGNLYGTANQGGSGQQGTIFKVASDGYFSLLHTFSSIRQGSNPAAGMLLAANGYLYGTTTEGGNLDGDGTVFELDPTSGSFAELHIFVSGNLGDYAYTPIISDPAGNLYGGTESGGTANRGLIYKIVPASAGVRALK